MENGCEHEEGSPIGKCSICERTVCSDCYREVFAAMICDLHPELEDESEWELIGFYNGAESVAERRFVLEENGIITLVVETDEETIELYVPTADKDDSFSSLSPATEDFFFCGECKIQYAKEMRVCPVCGVKPAEDVLDSDIAE